jgi:hypothetical protein
MFVDNQTRAITPASLRDLLESLVGVGGTLYGNDLTQAVTTAWGPFTAFNGAAGTKGLSAAGGIVTVGSGADGLYSIDVVVSFSSPGAGALELALSKNGAITPFKAKVDVLANKFSQFVITGVGELVEGNTFALAVKASGAATLTIYSAQMRAVRV